MDNERRHQLQQNELADQIDKAKTWIEPYVVPILIGVIAITVVGLVVNLVQSQRSSARSEATLDLLFSTAVGPSGEEDPEILDRVAKNFAGTSQAQVALISKADILLAKGIEALYRDRSEAETLLGDAATAYEQVLEISDISLLKSRAQFGLAQTLESQGKIDEAIAAYEKLIQLNESEGMTEVAQNRITQLKRPETQAFAAWFAEQKPQTFDPSTPPGLPGFDQLPGMPDIQLPGVGPETSGAGSTSNGQPTSPLSGLLQGPLKSSDQPLPENNSFTLPETNETPSEETPASDTPADADGEMKEQPAATETPEASTEQPAPEQPAPVEPAPEQPAPAEPAPDQPAPAEPAPEQPAPAEPAPEQPAPAEPAPDQPAPAEPAPEQPAPAEPAPEQPAPAVEPGDGGSGDGSQPSSSENPQP